MEGCIREVGEMVPMESEPVRPGNEAGGLRLGRQVGDQGHVVTVGSDRGSDGEGWREQQRQKKEPHVSEVELLGTQQGSTVDPGAGC